MAQAGANTDRRQSAKGCDSGPFHLLMSRPEIDLLALGSTLESTQKIVEERMAWLHQLASSKDPLFTDLRNRLHNQETRDPIIQEVFQVRITMDPR